MLSSTPISSSLHSPRPQPRRNHLRTKLLRLPLLHTPQPQQPPPPPLQQQPQTQPLLPIPIDQTPQHHEASHLHTTIGDPFPPSSDLIDPRRLIFELLLYFGVLTMQVVCTTLIFGGERRELQTGSPMVSEEDANKEEEFGGVEFEVLEEIRAMARKARAAEASGGGGEVEGEHDGVRTGVMEEVERRVRKMEKRRMRAILGSDRKKGGGSGKSGEFGDVRRRMEFGRIRAAVRRADAPPRGFGQSAGDGGGVKQSTEYSPLEQTKSHSVDRGISETGLSSLLIDPTISMPKDSLGGSNARTTPREGRSRLKRSIDSSASVINDLDQNTPQETPPNDSFSQKDDPVRQSADSLDSSKKEAESMALESYDRHRFHKMKTESKRTSAKGFGISRMSKNNHKAGNKISPITGEKWKPRSHYWWLKLPYVLAIYLHRGSNNGSSRGLYKLKMDSQSDGPSYTIIFQDRGDATNFCYLLESFFQDLGDVNADILPMTPKEVEKAVKGGELNVVVIPKGQLQLYAGQQLAEVETTLRSLLHQE